MKSKTKYKSTEFRSYIFEYGKTRKRRPILEFFLIFLGILVLNYVSEYNNRWVYFISFTGLGSIALYLNYGYLKFGRKEDLDGYYSDEIIVSPEGIRISSNFYSIDTIKSIEIKYDNIHGTLKEDQTMGFYRTNGETNSIKIALKDNRYLTYNFKLATIEHARQLLNISENMGNSLKILNDWKINYNA